MQNGDYENQFATVILFKYFYAKAKQMLKKYSTVIIKKTIYYNEIP
jgi:hypothetical protein